MDDTILIFLPICILLVIIAAIIVAKIFDSHTALTQTYWNTVQETSLRCRYLRVLNSQYHFSTYNPIMRFTHRLTSKAQFDHYNLDDLFLDTLEKNRTAIDQNIIRYETNLRLYRDYRDQLATLPDFASIEYAEEQGVPFKKYREMETELFLSLLLHPQHTFQIVCHKCYTSPQGKRNYNQSLTYTSQDVYSGYSDLEFRVRKQQDVQNQRSLMTPKLRYSIMQRDHFRCVLCGRDKDSGPLEVDHIIPVSKGGLTVPENLRTLCKDCNRGKGASYTPNGYN